MAKVLVLFAHPKFERSRVNRRLVEQIQQHEEVTFHDLYQQYPDFNIDVVLEKNLLSNHDVIIWHHPFYWYSCPPLMKQWIDVVLEYNWAYGPKGDALVGKQVVNVITTGGTPEVYCAQGNNNYSVNEFLRPFEQTAKLCGMDYLPPFAVMGTYQLTEDELDKQVYAFSKLLSLLKAEIGSMKLDNCLFLNDLPELTKSTAS